MRRLSLPFRLVLILAGTILVLQVLAVGVQLGRDDGFNFSGIRPAFVREVAGLVRLFERLPPARRAAALELLNEGRFNLELTDVAPVADKGGPLLSAMAGAVTARLAAGGLDADRLSVSFVPNAARKGEGRAQLVRLVGRHLEVAVSLSRGGYLVIDPNNDVDTGIYANLLGILASLFGLVVVVVAGLLAWRETRPLGALVANVEAFARSAVPRDLKPEGAPELIRLIEATNAMQHQIAALIRNRALILAGLSHDLRTQVTRLRLRLELLEEGPARNKAIADIEAMQGLIEETLEFAAASSAADGGSADAVAVLEQLAAAEAEAHPGRVSFFSPGGRAEVAIGATPLRRVLENLVGNALAYGGVADIALAVRGENVEISVADRGPGIPEAERQNIFEPFYRLETSRNRESGGTGLGLAIVQQIVSRHHGSVAVGERERGGAVFTVRLPRVG
jgi:two-component system osmolarity sensor histidine kinase EnvZ